MMNTRQLLLLLSTFTAAPTLIAQDIEGVHVETYYITDANDATDTIGISGGLPAGTRTYRVFIDLCDDCALRALYGSDCHPLSIESTALIFNHRDRGRSFGHAINNSALDEGTTALDSWLTLGAASNQRLGIRKELDTDGSIVGGSNNDGGSSAVVGGLLVNVDVDAGEPLTVSDGLVPLNGASALPPSFNPTGDDIAAVLGDTTASAAFVSTNCRVGCATPGTTGPTTANELLVAQITTAGDLSFELNIEVEHGDGSITRYVARDTCLAGDETANGLLRYPPDCGCTDPQYIEYDPSAGCDDGSCQTAIVFGCLDPEACNFDLNANFDVPQLCCYGIDDCNGLDPYLICPDVGVAEQDGSGLTVGPNPFVDALVLSSREALGAVDLRLMDGRGRLVLSRTVVLSGDGQPVMIDAVGLPSGLYVLRVAHERTLRIARVVKP